MELREAYLLMKLMKPEGGGATVEALNVTENGTYTPDEGVDGFAPVNVNVPKAGEAWPLTLKVDSGSACSAVYDNPYNLNRDGYFSLDGGSAHFSSFSIAKGTEKVINLAVLDRSDQGFSGHCIQDFLIVHGSTNGMKSMTISSNATATLMGTFTYGNKLYGIIKVEGQKNKVLVQNPYVSVSFSKTA